MRVAIALSALCTLAGCFGNLQDPNDSQGRDLALEEGTPPSAAAAIEPANADRPATMASTPCGPDFKWCRAADTPMSVENTDCCWTTAKQCYEFSMDRRVCDTIREFCGTLPVPPPPAADPRDEYERCVQAGKECLATTDDPRNCEMQLARCEFLLQPPTPAPTPYEQCYEKVMDCYAHSADTAECDRYRLSCDALLPAPTPPDGDPVAECYARVMLCYADVGDHPEKCDELRKSCDNVMIVE